MVSSGVSVLGNILQSWYSRPDENIGEINVQKLAHFQVEFSGNKRTS